LSMIQKKLRHGFTTGACAAAASLGAARMLKEQRLLQEVDILLPAGFAASFRLGGQRFDGNSAACFVVKDAGDDPDVTDGVEVHAEVRVTSSFPPFKNRGQEDWGIVIEGGTGIGRVTKKGLAVPVGEWAINPVPRRMIEEALLSVFGPLPEGRVLTAVLSIPDGVERARRTLNERLGILGGLSILGTTGVVRPVSHQAWTDTLDVALDVALAADLAAVVLSTGRTSEQVAQNQLDLPEEAFVMMGDHVGHALEACHRRGFRNIILAVQFAKLVKIGLGHAQTHVGNSRLELRELAIWGRKCGLDEDTVKKIECANTAREVYEMTGEIVPIVVRHGLAQARRRVPGAEVAILLAGYDGRPGGWFGTWPTDLERERKR
jgi:cobalt-precorrin-5B (C1)-methyltransferase